MSFGTLTPTQHEKIVPVVKGKTVHDFGAGDLSLATHLLEMGAQKVIAIDKTEPMEARKLPPDGPLVFCLDTHENYLYGNSEIAPEVAFLSWPFSSVDWALLKMASRAETVIYLGTNMGGTACGFPALFGHFLTRELVAHVPHRNNTLIILGGPAKAPRVPLYEELAGIDQSKVYSYSGE